MIKKLVNKYKELSGNYCTEWCSHCEEEVFIPSTRASECPNCKAPIRPCCMCDMEVVKCSECAIE